MKFIENLLRLTRQFGRLKVNFNQKTPKKQRVQSATVPISHSPAFYNVRKKSKILLFTLSLLLGLGVTQVYAAFPPTGTVSQTDPTTPQLVTVTHPREFRGVWVATVANIDWPSQPTLAVETQKAELIKILDQMKALNLNALVLQVRPAGDALYASSLEPWSYWLTGTQGKAPAPNYDPLQFAVEEAHKRNIELHAWFNPYRAKTSTNAPLAGNHMANQFPQYAYRYGDLLWMDPGAKVVQDKTYDVIMDVVRRYDIDGVHLDDYFYPYPQDGIPFPDSKTYGAYKANGGTLSLKDWRRENVNQLMYRLYQGIHATKPHVRFGISPFGIYRPGKAPGIVGLDQYDALYADAKKWLEQGWVDYMAPQLYWRIDPPQQSYPVLLNWWTQHNPQRRHIYAGNYLSKLDGQGWPISEFQRQVDISRKMAPQLSLGNIFFSMKVFKENRLGVNKAFQTALYPSPVLPPAMNWLDAEPPAPPTNVAVNAGYITWDSAASNDIRSWTIYQQVGNSWKLVAVVPKNTTAAKVQRGNYAIAAVDDTNNESQGVMVSMQ